MKTRVTLGGPSAFTVYGRNGAQPVGREGIQKMTFPFLQNVGRQFTRRAESMYSTKSSMIPFVAIAPPWNAQNTILLDAFYDAYLLSVNEKLT